MNERAEVLADYVQQLMEENKRFKEALEKYAKWGNWGSDNWHKPWLIAQEALHGTPKDIARDS